ncbi:hypothetical protein MLD38_017933 [Melastoma candidum]|uniref:Uncharacterized protein n=1 Tax=Melastoma candidum TaxID=119954 RepID=A0ACB9QWB5_9MYRT|nr:hypothetical protein MLD38_017933 [Melastoma candidum]
MLAEVVKSTQNPHLNQERNNKQHFVTGLRCCSRTILSTRSIQTFLQWERPFLASAPLMARLQKTGKTKVLDIARNRSPLSLMVRLMQHGRVESKHHVFTRIFKSAEHVKSHLVHPARVKITQTSYPSLTPCSQTLRLLLDKFLGFNFKPSLVTYFE